MNSSGVNSWLPMWLRCANDVTELGRKEYQRLLESPDFVIMFIPNEPAFLAALQSDPSIWGRCLRQEGDHLFAHKPLCFA